MTSELLIPIVCTLFGVLIGYLIGRNRTLSKRESLAASALQGILANTLSFSEETAAGVAVKSADALLVRLRNNST